MGWGWDDMSSNHLASKVQNGWRSTETPCGRGSELANAALAADAISVACEDYEISSMANVGAGDLNWIGEIPWRARPPDIKHFDLYPRHPEVVRFDAVRETLDKFDMIVCRHVLNHLSCRMVLDALTRFQASGSRWLLMTACRAQDAYWSKWLCWPDEIRSFPDFRHWRLNLYDLKIDHPFAAPLRI